MVLPGAREPTAYLDAAAIAARLPPGSAAFATAVRLGLIAPKGDGYVVSSRHVLDAAIALGDAGVPIERALALFADTRRDVEQVARRLVECVDAYLLGGPDKRRMPRASEVGPVAEVVVRLRALAEEVVRTELSRALEAAVRARLGA